MRIGILTLPLKINYGGLLQAYALQKVLKELGHEVETIDKFHHFYMPLWKMILLFPIRAFKKYVLKRKEGIFREWVHNKRYPIISTYTEPFIKENIKRFESTNYPKVERGQYDCIIVGSDQIWRKDYNKHIEGFYLDYADSWDIKRIAYAASFGTDRWQYDEKETMNCKRLIQLFDAVSVRESSAVKLCCDNFNVNVEHVLDPTMLLDKSEYVNLFVKSKTLNSDGNMLCYILDPSKETDGVVKKVEYISGLKPFSVISKFFNSSMHYIDNIQPPVERWIRGFYDAEFVVTDSFHGCVFSIIFNKPFMVLYNENRGTTRIDSLLEDFGLTSRILSDVNDIERIFNEKIDFQHINRILHKKTIDSLRFLKNSLEQ